MIERFVKWVLKKCVLFLDRDSTLMAFSFGRDEITDYHVIVERCFPDRHLIGTREEQYERG